MTDSPVRQGATRINIDQRWSALETGLADVTCPDFDASLFDDGPGPWLVLKGSHSDGPDPDDVFTVPTSAKRLLQGLTAVQAAHAAAEDWASDDRTLDPRSPGARIVVYLSETSEIYEAMRANAPIMDHAFNSIEPIEDLARSINEIILDQLENRDAPANAPQFR